ncbi:MAG: glucosamine-6-phosphate deaminase [Saprospiraceae bacterium]|nr:glucosamine-6-phosphate deaminase [Saprospiraceae bacterium]
MAKRLQCDLLEVSIHPTRQGMGQAAGQAFLKALETRLKSKDHVRAIFAAAPSQAEFLHFLCQQKQIDWRRVIAFHMDEYLGLPADSEASFGHFLGKHLFDQLPFGEVHYIDPAHDKPTEELQYYTNLLREEPIDLVAMGIGENGHIAFNDPPVADFNDPEWVKIVALDEVCRQQQVNDGAFSSLSAVPTHAITLTIPALMSADQIVCIVPGPTKQLAVKNTLEGTITTACPASILRRHKAAALFLDEAAAALLKKGYST